MKWAAKLTHCALSSSDIQKNLQAAAMIISVLPACLDSRTFQELFIAPPKLLKWEKVSVSITHAGIVNVDILDQLKSEWCRSLGKEHDFAFEWHC